MAIPCFKDHNLNHLDDELKKAIATGVPEKEAATKIAERYFVEEHKKLSDELNELKKTAKVKQHTYVGPTIPVEPPPHTPPSKQTPHPEPELSGIKKALVPEAKVAEMADKLEQRTNEEFLAQGKTDVESGDINPVALVNDVVEHHRALQTHEVAALVYYKAKMDNRFNAINVLIAKGKKEGGDPSELTYLKRELELLNQDRDKFHEMQLITAREQGRAFGLRKMLLDNEYNLQDQINQYKAISKDGEIPPDVLEHLKSIDEKLQKANAKIAELEKQAESKTEKATIENIKKETKKQTPKIKRGKDLIAEGVDELAQALGVTKMAAGGIRIDPVRALEKIGRGLIDEGLATLENVGQKIKEYIDEKFKGKIKFEDYEKAVVAKITASFPRPTIEDGKLKIPQTLIRDMVQSGIDTIEGLTKAIHDIVKKDHPEITERQVRDTITQYGKTVNLSKEEVNVKIRELKRVGKLISGLEDVKRQLRPLRSGLQRDKLTDKERTMQRELKEAMKDLPEDTAETEKVWKTAIETTKTRLRNQITDLEEQIKTGAKTPKKKGIEYDIEAKELQAKRDQLRDQLNAIEGKPEMSDEQRLRQAKNNAEKTLKEYERKVREGDFEVNQKRAPINSEDLTQLRQQRDLAREQYEKIKEELGIAEKQRLEKAKQTVKKSQMEYERKVREGDFAKKEKKSVVPDKELDRAILDREKAKYEYEVAQEKNRLANRPTSQKVSDFLLDVFNIPKSLVSSVDLSAIFRQGFLLSVAHPTSAGKALIQMLKKMASKSYSEDWLHKLKQSDIYPELRASKLYIADSPAKLSAREENFVSHIIRRVPIVGRLVAGSERAYAGYLNAIRLDVFAKGSDFLKDSGYTMENNKKAFQDWASFINNATGRGDLGAFENSAPVLNAIFFSPRFLASRLNIMNPLTYAKMDVKARQMAMGDTLKYIAFGSSVLGMAAATGAEVELDPRSTDFGKIKIGNTRYDIWAGFQPIVRVIAQLASGQTKSASGKINDLNSDKFGAKTRADVIGSFFRGKEAPTVSAIHNLLSGKNVIGEPVTPLGELERNVIPLYIQDITTIYQNEGIKGVVPIAIPAMLGIGVQNYPSAGIPKDTDASKVSATHDYYFSVPSRFSHTFASPPTIEQYNKFVKIRGELIIDEFNKHKDNLTDANIKNYKTHMDHIVKRATKTALRQAGIPLANHREVDEEEVDKTPETKQ